MAQIGRSPEERKRPDPITIPVSDRLWDMLSNIDFRIVGNTLFPINHTGRIDLVDLSGAESDQNVQFKCCHLGDAQLNLSLENALGMDYDPDQNILAVVIFK